MKTTVLFVILSCHQTSSLNTNSTLFEEVFAYHEKTTQKANFANEVVNKIYTAFHQWFFTITFCEFTYFENRILKYTENYGYGYPVLLLNGCPDTNKTRVKPRLDKHGKTTYMVTAENLAIDGSDYVVETLERTGLFKPRSAVIFIINEIVTIDNYFYFTVKSHFQLLWSRSITNSVLILRTDRLKIYTYNPFLDQVKDITDVKDISRFLTVQYHNLYGYALRISVFRKVYVSNETGPIRCDSHLAKTVISFLNATCVPMVPRDGNTVGDLLNGVATGVTADLIDGYSDMELSSRILKNSYYGYIDTTYPLSQDRLCFLIKNSEKQATFTTTIDLLTHILLCVFMFILTSCIILAIIVRKVESQIFKLDNKQTVGETALDLVKCFMRQTVDIKFWGPVFRVIIFLVVIYSLIVNCVIDGVIFSGLSHTRYRPNINTMAELVASNLTLGIHNRDIRIFNKSLSVAHYEALKNRIEIFNDQKIKDVLVGRQYQYATLIRQSDAVYISTNPAYLHNGRGLFHVVQDCPVPCSIVYGLRYGCPYLPRINFITSNLYEAGIIQHWSTTEEYTLQKKISADQKLRNPLNMDNIREVFYVLLVGLFLSLTVFIFEIVYCYKVLMLTHLKLFLKTLVRRFQRLNFRR